MDAMCPNCGDTLVDYRTDRQSTGGREVILYWTLCSGCRHIGLKTWMIARAENPNPRRQVDRSGHDLPRSRRSEAG